MKEQIQTVPFLTCVLKEKAVLHLKTASFFSVIDKFYFSVSSLMIFFAPPNLSMHHKI